MKTYIGSLFTLLALCNCTGAATPRPTPPQQTPAVVQPAQPPTAEQRARVAQANNEFGLGLWSQLRSTQGNLTISPASVWTAMAMLQGGARGETAEELARVLRFSGDARAMHEAAGRQLAAWNDTAEGGYTLRVVNRLFGEQSDRFEPTYLELARNTYHAPLEGLNFRGAAEASRQRINGWVEEQTEHQITELVPRGTIGPDTSLVLTNAVYFLGKWEVPFKHEGTYAAPFSVNAQTTVTVPTMHAHAVHGYAALEGVKVLELGYRGGNFAMTLVLPDARDGLDAVEAKLDAATLERWTKSLQQEEVQVSMPKFKLEPQTAMTLSGQLRALGMARTFSSAADFTGIAQGVSVSEVLHKTMVLVDEDGTEAAAATAVVTLGSAAMMPREVPVFNADHPFLFFLRDVRTGAVLFVGRVQNPEQHG